MPAYSPLYSNVQTGPARPLDLEDYHPGIWESISQGFQEGWESNPFWNMGKWAALHPFQSQGTIWEGMSDYAAAGIAGSLVEDVRGKPPAFAPQAQDSEAQAGAAVRMDALPSPLPPQTLPGTGPDAVPQALPQALPDAAPQALPDLQPDGQPQAGPGPQASLDAHGFDWSETANPLVRFMQASEPPRLAPPPEQQRKPRPLSLAEQQARIEAAGLTGAVQPKPEYDAEALAIILDDARTRRTRALLGQNEPLWHKPFSLAASFAAGALDPLNIASAFIPVLGEARMLSLLGKASGAWGRAGWRALQGGLSGLAGAVALEPLVSAQQRALQRDYGMGQSLLNIGLGALLGASIAPAAGRVAEVRKARSGQINPWEYVDVSYESMQEMNQLTREIHSARMAASPGLDVFETFSQARQAALFMDEQIRHLAWAEKIPVADAYAKARVRFQDAMALQKRVGELEAQLPAIRQEYEDLQTLHEWASRWPHLRLPDDPGQLAAAHSRLLAHERRLEAMRLSADHDWRELTGSSLYMARELSDAASVEEFVRDVKATKKNNLTYIVGKVTRPEIGLENMNVDLLSGRALHIIKRHPEMNEWHRIREIIEKGDIWITGHSKQYKYSGLGFVANSGNRKILLRGHIVPSKKWGTTFRVESMFQNSETAIMDFLKSENATPLSPRIGSHSIQDGTALPDWTKEIRESSAFDFLYPPEESVNRNLQERESGQSAESLSGVEHQTEMTGTSRGTGGSPGNPSPDNRNAPPLAPAGHGGALPNSSENVNKNFPEPQAGAGAAKSMAGGQEWESNAGAASPLGLLENRPSHSNGHPGQKDGTTGDITPARPLEDPPSDATGQPEKRVYTEADLVKLKAENPTRYQLVQTSAGVQELRGAYTPAASPGAAALIRLFQSHDQATVIHELSHHARRMYERLATGGSADPLFLSRYRAIEKRFGVVDGQWSRAQEEAFASEFGGAWLTRHELPPDAVAPAYAGMRELALDLYENADSLGLPMSAEAREALDAMLTIPMAEGRRRLNEAMADINTRRHERLFLEEADLAPLPQSLADEATSLERLLDSTQEISASVERDLELLQGRDPELARALAEERASDLAAHERGIQLLDEQERILPELVTCYYNAGA